jgi:glycosyltransferase involved in cell wall biosynthesis
MRILWVKANKILPLHSGGDIRSFNLLRQLAAQDEVIFLSYYDGPVDREYENEIAKQLPGAVCVCTGKRQDSNLARGIDYLLHWSTAAPYSVSRFASFSVREKVKECLARKSPDVLVCDFLDAAINLPEPLTIPSILFQHNVESEIWRRHEETCTHPVRKHIYKREFRKMLRYEEMVVRRFSRVVAVSDHDRSLMSAWVDPSCISVVPTGVDLARFRVEGDRQASGSLVMFVGAMDWEPNIDAVEYFCTAVWPEIKTKVADARFRIVGRNPGSRVQRLAAADVEVTGSVPSVVDHLREAAVVVVPLRIGGGTRLKIYEAMAAGKAIVSTTVGAEGLEIHPGKDIWLADHASSMAEAVVTLLQDPERRRGFERAAVTQAAKFDWSVVAERFRQTIQNALFSGGGDKSVDQLTAMGFADGYGN